MLDLINPLREELSYFFINTLLNLVDSLMRKADAVIVENGGSTSY